MKNKITTQFSEYQAKVNAFLADLSKYSTEELQSKKTPETWSVIQNLMHLIMAESGSLAYCRKKMAFGGEYDSPGIKSQFRYVQLIAAMYLPIKIKAPAAIDGENVPNNLTLAEVKAKWDESFANWQHFFESLPDDLVDKVVYKHPRAGKISWSNMIGFFSVHFDRHRGQIGRDFMKK
jgi:DinB superfamily